MTKVKRWIGLLSLLICVLIGIWIVQDNPLEVPVTLLGFPLVQLPLGIWLLAAFLGGSMLSYIAGLPSTLRKTAQVRRLERQLGLAAAEIKKSGSNNSGN
ncbi:MAG: lipopolysaccharide assembly protein LapA domain-containing protein [Porticoccaceae bacterium]|nr:lipopolysaccharide assembly protein LapA domain-containing protein [Porticoccaceae bacterium]